MCLIFMYCFLCVYTVSQEGIHDIIDCNLKKDYQILIIFGARVSDTTGRQMTIQSLIIVVQLLLIMLEILV